MKNWIISIIVINKSLLKKAPNEHYGLSRKDRKRPDGLTLTTWKNGKCLIWDFTCADTLCQSSIKQCSKEAGAAAEKRKKIKIGQWLLVCPSRGRIFWLLGSTGPQTCQRNWGKSNGRNWGKTIFFLHFSIHIHGYSEGECQLYFRHSSLLWKSWRNIWVL